jgi:hypothetical protein
MSQTLASPPCENPFIELAAALRGDAKDEGAAPFAG